MASDRNIRTDLFPYLPQKVINLLEKMDEYELNAVTEIRLRMGRPLSLCLGKKIQIPGHGVIMEEEDIKEAWRLVTASSVYALEEELKRGYITLKGGHRVGLAGSAVWKDGKIKTQKNIASLNYRFAREVRNCGESLLPYLMTNGNFENTLLFSPPGCGKTTLLRDLVRLISDLETENLVVVDERGEIAAGDHGFPLYDVGNFTDVLHGFSKSEGMLLALRSLGPTILVTDEIGNKNDMDAVMDSVRCGVSLLLTAHGGSLEELQSRPVIKELLQDGIFHHLVSLGRVPKPGTIGGIYHRTIKDGRFCYVEDPAIFTDYCRHGSRGKSSFL